MAKKLLEKSLLVPLQKYWEMDGQVPQAKLPQEVHSLKEKKVGKENKHPPKERREIYFELRSFNIYFSSRCKH